MLYANNGDGTFRDVSRESGIAAVPGWGMGVICADYDNDGATDIFVANDVPRTSFGRTTAAGTSARWAWLPASGTTSTATFTGTLGVECGDYNNDGRLDFYVTAYQHQMATLFTNLGRGQLQDTTLTSAAGLATRRNVTWGSGMVDFDNDGDKDLFVVCGHVLDNVEQIDDTTSYAAHTILLRNLGNGKFEDVSDTAGDALRVKSVGRGVAFEDLDNDGDIDVVILNSRREPTILRNMLNENGSKNHWLEIRLRGVKTNRDGVGARVRVAAGNLVQIDEVHSGRGYQRHWGSRLHFGLGGHERVDRVEVHWIGGGVDVWENVAVDRLLTLTEGDGPAG